VLIALDGTEYFCSQKLGCPQCLTRRRSNGKVEGSVAALRRRPERVDVVG
jgi:hypothetical protein